MRSVSLIILSCLLWSSLSLSFGLAAEEQEIDPLGGLVCFGDSITFGVGDGTEPGEQVFLAPFPQGSAGYPLRLEQILSTPVRNIGIPGEIFTTQGVNRFPAEVLSSPEQIVTIMEGSNDAFILASATDYEIALQKAVNVARALGKEVVLGTLPETCCDRSGLTLFTNSFSNRVREVAFLNDLKLADIELYWQESCPSRNNCPLLNRPEGLHPNSLGYDFIAEIFAAVIEDRIPFAPIKEDEQADGSESEGESA